MTFNERLNLALGLVVTVSIPLALLVSAIAEIVINT